MADVNTNAGKVVLWIGNECAAWTPADFGAAAKFARSLGVDTISPKRANGSVKWYRDAANLAAERQAVTDNGAGYLPFVYDYAGGYTEMGAVQEILAVNGSAMLDWEAEFNYKPQVALDEIKSIGAHDGHFLYLTSWANPHAQGWDAVLKDILPYIDCYVPQVYNDHLASDQYQVAADIGNLPEQVGLDLTQEFGPNHQLAIAQQAIARGVQTLWLWEYRVARQYPDVVRQLVAAMHAQPVSKLTYTVEPGDTLWSIIHKLGLSISAAQLAAENGIPNPNLIYPGQVLEY